jgi:hypothetical protein
VLAIISQVIAAARKSQAEARRRALEAERQGPRPVTRRREPPPDDYLDEIPEEELVEPGSPEREWEAPVLRPPPLVATHRPVAFPAPTPILVPPTMSLAPEPRRQPPIRLDRKRLKEAIVLLELIGPPVSMR